MILSERGKSPQSTPPTVPKKRKGFCECCQETFEDLQLVRALLAPNPKPDLILHWTP